MAPTQQPLQPPHNSVKYLTPLGKPPGLRTKPSKEDVLIPNPSGSQTLAYLAGLRIKALLKIKILAVWGQDEAQESAFFESTSLLLPPFVVLTQLLHGEGLLWIIPVSAFSPDMIMNRTPFYSLSILVWTESIITNIGPSMIESLTWATFWAALFQTVFKDRKWSLLISRSLYHICTHSFDSYFWMPTLCQVLT